MFKSYTIYPKNKIIGGSSILQFPLRHTNSFSTGKIKKFDYNPVYPKAKKIKKLIEEINSSNRSFLFNNNYNKNNDENNNIYICQKLLLEERMKNKNYTDNIIKLNNHINELEYKLSQKCEHEHHMMKTDDEFIKLKKENEELKSFKQKVYELSMKYDEINNDILLYLKNIEKIVESYQSYSEDKINSLDKITDNFNSIAKNLTNYLNTKQDEYNTLIMEKEKEINELKNELNYKNNINQFSNNIKYARKNELELDNLRENKNDYNINYYHTNENYEPYYANNINLENENEGNIHKNTFENV